MKYTRYNVKKNKSGNSFLIILFLILILAFLAATLIFKVFFKGKDNLGLELPNIKQENILKQDTTNKDSDTKDTIVNANESNSETDNKSGEVNNKEENYIVDIKNISFYALQCGVFKSGENAESLKKSLEAYGHPFIVNDGELSRVMFGIYREDEIDNMVNFIADKGIETNKVKFNITTDNICKSEIVELINAQLKVISKLSEKDIKSIETDDLKKWVDSLAKVKEGETNYKDLQSMKSFIGKMPKELYDDDIDEGYTFIYNFLRTLES